MHKIFLFFDIFVNLRIFHGGKERVFDCSVKNSVCVADFVAREKGYSKDLLEQIFISWWQYGGFAKIFSKCSDMGLVLTSYQLAYLKAHYPKEWTELQILENIFTRR